MSARPTVKCRMDSFRGLTGSESMLWSRAEITTLHSSKHAIACWMSTNKSREPAVLAWSLQTKSRTESLRLKLNFNSCSGKGFLFCIVAVRPQKEMVACFITASLDYDCVVVASSVHVAMQNGYFGMKSKHTSTSGESVEWVHSAVRSMFYSRPVWTAFLVKITVIVLHNCNFAW